MKFSPRFALLVLSLLLANCGRFPGNYRGEDSARIRTPQELDGSYFPTASPANPWRMPNLATKLSLKGDAETGAEAVQLEAVGSKRIKVRMIKNGQPADEFFIDGRMRRGMFVYRNEVERSGLPWVWGGMHYDQAAIGKNALGKLVVRERTGGWEGLLFLRIGAMNKPEFEYEPVH